MKNITVFILLILLSLSSFSQIDNCSQYNSKIYSEEDITHFSLLELKILRNEIYARHQYIFKDDRLSDYFLKKYDWYKPNYKSENKIELNNFEKKNISLLLKKENEKIALKNTIIEKLKVFKQALISNDTIKSNSNINKFVTDNEYVNLSSIREQLNEILTSINIDKIHWYNESGLFKVTTDDGHFLNEKSIKINNFRIILQYSDIGHSELLNKETAFSFGSDFYSENEHQSWYTFEIQNNELVLIAHQAAG
jgi:hypothetical protein